jgi:hypothetical protein
MQSAHVVYRLGVTTAQDQTDQRGSIPCRSIENFKFLDVISAAGAVTQVFRVNSTEMEVLKREGKEYSGWWGVPDKCGVPEAARVETRSCATRCHRERIGPDSTTGMAKAAYIFELHRWPQLFFRNLEVSDEAATHPDLILMRRGVAYDIYGLLSRLGNIVTAGPRRRNQFHGQADPEISRPKQGRYKFSLSPSQTYLTVGSACWIAVSI